jgi:hypothetical protein
MRRAALALALAGLVVLCWLLSRRMEVTAALNRTQGHCLVVISWEPPEPWGWVGPAIATTPIVAAFSMRRARSDRRGT